MQPKKSPGGCEAFLTADTVRTLSGDGVVEKSRRFEIQSSFVRHNMVAVRRVEMGGADILQLEICTWLMPRTLREIPPSLTR